MSDAQDREATSLTLLERARNNDAAAWERIVRLYTPLVHHWCVRGGLRGADAEDIMQEVFRGAVSGLGKFRRDRPGDTFRGWLRGITRNQVLLHYRRSGGHPRASGGSDAFVKLQEIVDPVIDLPDDDPVPEVQGLYRRALELVRSEFEDRTWQMFWLTAVEDRQTADVAAQFAVSVAAVHKARSRVLRRLKEEVGDLAE